MFYFCFKAGSSPELQEDTELFTFQHKRMRRWRVVGHCWAAYATPKTSSQPRAWLVPSPVSETVFRCCGRKHGGLLLGTEGPQCPREARWDGGYLSPSSPHRALSPVSRTLHPVISLHLCFSSWNSFPQFCFSKHPSVWEHPKGLLRRVHAFPISIILLHTSHSTHPTAGAHPPHNQNPRELPPQRAQGTQHSVPTAGYSSLHLEL